MKQIVKAKHWMIFLILAPAFFATMILPEIDLSFKTAIIVRIGGIIIFFGWLLLLGMELNKLNGNYYQINIVIFLLAILFPTCTYIEMNLQMILPENNFIPEYLGFLLMPLSIWGFIYTFYKLPKMIKSLEVCRKVKFSECIVDALLIFFFPIGIWFLQPIINKISNDNKL